jgi:hypothetical protein
MSGGGVDRLILDDIFLFVGIITAMGCFTGIVISMIKRRSKALPSPEVSHRLDEIAERLARLETAVDASSVEIERISEGQRFTTKLLADRAPAAMPLVVDKDRKASH